MKSTLGDDVEVVGADSEEGADVRVVAAGDDGVVSPAVGAHGADVVVGEALVGVLVAGVVVVVVADVTGSHESACDGE